MSSNPAASRLALLAGLLGAYLLVGSLYALKTPAWQVPDEPAHYNYIAHLVATGTLPVLQPGDYDGPYLEQLKGQRFPPELSIASVRYEGWQPPLYYLLAAPVFAATGGSLLAVRLFTLIVGGGVIVLAYLLARTLAPGQPLLALTAAGFVAFLPQHIAMMAAANNDALAEVVIALGLLLSIRALLMQDQGSWSRLVGAAPSGRPGLEASPQREPSVLRGAGILRNHQGRHRGLPLRSNPTTSSGKTRRTLRPPSPRFWLMGLVLGLAFLTKLSAYPLAAIMGLALLLLVRRERWSAAQSVRVAVELYAPALVLGGLWWTRNLAVYGGLDFLALQRHDEVVVGQLRLFEALVEWGAGGYLSRFFTTTFRSFWGQFGWMGVVMDPRVYQALLLFTVLLAIGAIGALASLWRRRARLSTPQRDVALLLAASLLLTLAVYLYYNLSFVQFQGRYLYPSLPVVALGAAAALSQWARWLTDRFKLTPAMAHAGQLALTLAPIALLALLAVFALYRFIVPALAG